MESGCGLEVNYRIDKSIEVGLCAVVALVRSQRCRSRSRSKSMGLNKLKQYGQAIQLAVAGRSRDVVEPNPIHGRLLMLV